MPAMATLRTCTGALLAALLGVFPAHADEAFPVEARPTSLLRGSRAHPAVVLALRLLRPLDVNETLLVHAGAVPPVTVRLPRNAAGETVFVPLPIAPGAYAVAAQVEVRTARAAAGPLHASVPVDVPRPGEGWVVHLIPGFHYDPVWWNTQANYTETGAQMGSDVGPGLDLMDDYLALLRAEPTATVALHQLPYLKTYLEARPWRGADLRAAVRSGRAALAGGTYNELASTLVGPEVVVRSAVYGALFQREVLGGRGRTFWQCDVFGHDPSFPSLMAATGHQAGAFARGPFHQWGAPREQVNFPSEFLWMGPDGNSILTHYMTGHYGYAYGPLAALVRLDSTLSPRARHARWESALAGIFEDLKRPALTHHILAPMHSDFVRPVRGLEAILAHWNATYLSPRIEMSTPERFFAAVRAEVDRRDLVVPVITRDMNPIYTGCAVSFADLKIAQRDCERALRDAEILATWAGLEGTPYPAPALDRAWRQLLFAAHHDGVTGSMSDQVYVDLMYAYRDAFELANGVRDRAAAQLCTALGLPDGGRGAVWNTLAAPRDGVPAAGVVMPGPPALREHPAHETGANTWKIENETLAIIIDLERGGTLASLRDKHAGRELLRGPGAELVAIAEHENLPGHGEGPWHLAPTGERRGGTGARARRIANDDPHAVTVETVHPEYTQRQTYALRPGVPWLEMCTEILDWRGRNTLLRVEFPLAAPGGRPVYDTAAGVIARPYARDVATGSDPWTLDQTAQRWVDWGTTCTLEVWEGGTLRDRRSLGVGEIVLDAEAPRALAEAANRMAKALVQSGVTTTVTHADRRRYGDLAFDSNFPDFRILLGAPRRLLPRFGLGEHDPVARAAYLAADSVAIPIVVVPGVALVDSLVAELAATHAIRIPASQADLGPPRIAADGGVALFNRGSVSVHASAAGTLSLNLMRSCTGWPAGVWIDAPRRRLPDGAPFETMHGSARFEYALYPHAGDWRAAQVPAVARDYDEPLWIMTADGLRALPGGAIAAGDAGNTAAAGAAAMGFIEVQPEGVQLMACKPAGFAAATWTTPVAKAAAPVTRVVLRLWNGTGRAEVARVRVRHATGRAWLATALEEAGARVRAQDGVLSIPLGPHAYQSVICEVKARPRVSATPAASPVPDAAAYWLENRSEGTDWNGLLTLSPESRDVAWRDGSAATRVFVVNNHRRETAHVRLDATAGAAVEVRLGARHVAVAPGKAVSVTLQVRAAVAGTEPDGAVQIRATWGGTADSVAVSSAVWIRPARGAPATPGFEVRTETPVVAATGALRATLVNHSATPVTGEFSWITPRIAWEAVQAWRVQVTLPAHGTQTVVSAVRGAAVTWAMPRFTAAGRLAYGATAQITPDSQRVLLRSAVDRLRVRAGGSTTLRAEAVSVGGLTRDAGLALAVPSGFTKRIVERRFAADSSGTRLESTFEVNANAGARDAVLELRAPPSGRVTVPINVVPVLHSRPRGAAEVIDGDLAEWSDGEFTAVTSPLGTARAAVRWSSDGLLFAFAVQDESFVQTHTGGDIWSGDSVQMGLTVVPSNEIGYDAHVVEFGVARSVDGPLVWCWYGGAGGHTGRVEAAAAAVRTDGDWTRYEAWLPARTLAGIPLAAGTVLGFSYIANDDDGAGFRGAIQWTRGMSGGKDASAFGDLILEKE